MATLATAAQTADPGRPVTRRPLVILGGGEHARVVADAARSSPDSWELVGFGTADATEPPDTGLGLPWLGDDAAVERWLAGRRPAERASLVLGFGAAAPARAAVADGFPAADWATLVHATATVSPSAVLGAGAVVLAGAVINAGARIGTHAIVNSAAVVEHDVVVGPFAHLGPGVVVGGGATIGAATHVGLGAIVRDHVTVGERVTVGMGAVVVADVPDGETVVGNPAARLERPAGG